MKKNTTPHIIPEAYNKPIEISADKEPLTLLRHFQSLRAANYELTQTWCIVPGSENPICWSFSTAYLNVRTGELTVDCAPGVAFQVDGLALNGGIIIVRGNDGDYVIGITDFSDMTERFLPITKEKDLITTLDHVINGDATRAERIAHLATIAPDMAEAILAGKRVLIL